MHKCNANANPNEKHFWSQEIERVNTWTMSDRLTDTESFASTLFKMQTWSWS